MYYHMDISIMKSMMKFLGIVVLLIGFSITGCEDSLPENNGANGAGDVDDSFVPVINIAEVKTSVPVGTVSLGGKVVPSNATNKTIKWSIQPGGDIEATISGDSLTTTWDGFVKVRATIENGLAEGIDYTKNFTISVDPFVPVSYIIFEGPVYEEVGNVYLDATVYPEDASYTDIVWSIKDAGTTKATIKGAILTTTAIGRVWITATIFRGLIGGTDYIRDFYIFIVEEL